MTWKLTKLADDWEPLPGVPWREMSDEEFEVVAREYAKFNQFPRTALHGSQFFHHVEDAPAKSSEKKED